MVAPYVLRRHKSDVLKELPERQVHDIFLTLDEAQEQLYRQIEGRFRRSVAVRIQQLGYERARFTILEALTRLRRAACDPSLIPGIDKAPSSKRAFIVEMVNSLVAAGHRSLIFSQWPTFLKNVRHDLDEQGVDSLYLDGQTTNRGHLCAKWNKKMALSFLISLKAGGTGLNLTGADTVIHLDPWWNPAIESQAMDRAYRIGQTKKVNVYRLIATRTVEERVVRTQRPKNTCL